MLATVPEPMPLHTDDHGVVRVGGTRGTLDQALDQVVHAFLRGATAEEVAMRYASLTLADVYATITCDLRHRSEVDDYMARQRQAAEDARARHAEILPVSDLRSSCRRPKPSVP